MSSLRRHEGYLRIDNRVAGGGLFESATVTCAHCQRVVVLNPDRQRPRGYCAPCDHYICDNPICHAGCRPMAQVFDDLERAIRQSGVR